MGSSSSMILHLEGLLTSPSQAAQVTRARATARPAAPLMVDCLTTALHLTQCRGAQEQDQAIFLTHHTVTLHRHLIPIDLTGTMYHHSRTIFEVKTTFGTIIFRLFVFKNVKIVLTNNLFNFIM